MKKTYLILLVILCTPASLPALAGECLTCITNSVKICCCLSIPYICAKCCVEPCAECCASRMSKLLMKTDVAAPGLRQMERDEARSALITRRRIAVADGLKLKAQ